MIYIYEILDGPDATQTFEIEHSVKEPARQEAEFNGRVCKVKRVIAQTTFHLKGGCWSRDNYNARIQPDDK